MKTLGQSLPGVVDILPKIRGKQGLRRIIGFLQFSLDNCCSLIIKTKLNETRLAFSNHFIVSINFLAILQNYKKFESRSITKCLGPLTVQTKFDGKSSFWVDAEMRQKVLGALEIAFFVRLSIWFFTWF